MQEFATEGNAEVEAIVSRVLDVVARDEPLPAHAAMLLLRRFIVSPRTDLSSTLGIVLARALEAARPPLATIDSASWLTVFVEASSIADDERINAAATDLVDQLRASWHSDVTTTPDGFAACAASIDACLRASGIVDAATIVPPAIDELERIVGATYRPGAGIVGGALTAHVAGAWTLLTAFDMTGRLPYSMLAEELIQPARRAAADSLGRDCATARVLCRLAALHEDRGYREVAVIAPDADYRGDAARILRSHGAGAHAAPLNEAALYALAYGELMSSTQP